MKRGPKGTTGITTSMYFDYCQGISIGDVAERWGVGRNTVAARFRRMGLPLRARSMRCTCRAGNPHRIVGKRLVDANRERTIIASRVMCERAAAAIPNTRSARVRGILQLRIDHPEKSLSELAALHDPPLTKHTVSAALRRAAAKV